MKQLERLLFLQGHGCFFSGEPIPPGEERVEHLVATSNGGAKDDQNCVAGCKAVNIAFGNLSVKAKLQAVLNQRGSFSCPKSAATTDSPVIEPSEERVALVVADLRKRDSARPRRVSSLKKTINAAFHMSLSASELDALLATLQSKGYVFVEETKVSYALPPSGV